MSNTIAINHDNIINHNISPCVTIVKRLDIREAKLAGSFLDGCSIYATGFQIQHRDKINKVLNVGSTTRFDDISDALTHVIVEESIKLKKPAPEELFGIDDNKSKPVDFKKIKPQTVVPIADNDDDEPNIVQQYLQKSNALINRSANIHNQTNSAPDYGVVPITGAQLRHTNSEIVTNLYIEDCINNEKIIDIAYYHRPLAVSASVKPLADCVLANLFARRTNIEKGLYAATHLICTAPMGNKYVAAVKWNLPAVIAEWLLACAEKLQLIDETPYLVGETVVPIRENNLNSSIMTPPINTSTRQILTPKRTLTQTPGLDTP
ncbi:hypothetical protein PV325_010794 [Microctonus aethiopoides]|nr:hypothetical protein PV325_010794 [Microctonus aethiopoides]